MAGPEGYDPQAFDPEAFDPEAFDLGVESESDPDGSFDRDAFDTGAFSEDAFDFGGGSGGAFTPASVLVRAYRACYYGNELRVIGAQFSIVSPHHFTPHGMIMLGTPPADWMPLLTVYSQALDIQSLRFPGRDETRVPVGGRSTVIRSEAGNPYD